MYTNQATIALGVPIEYVYLFSSQCPLMKVLFFFTMAMIIFLSKIVLSDK